MMIVDNFIKNWKDELKSKSKKMKTAVPCISIVEIGNPAEIMLEKSKEVGIIGFVYRIPEDSGIDTKELKALLRQAESETGVAWLEKPVPDFIDLREIDERYYTLPVGEGVSTFLKSQNIYGGLVRVLLGGGYDVELEAEGICLGSEEIKELGYCQLLEKCLEEDDV